LTYLLKPNSNGNADRFRKEEKKVRITKSVADTRLGRPQPWASQKELSFERKGEQFVMKETL